MMEYTGNHKKMFSTELNQEVNILEYKDPNPVKQRPGSCHWYYCECDKCHKEIKSHMFVVQSAEDDVEMLYLGADCIKKFH